MNVTGVEKDISLLGLIISRTDLNGTILEANDAFVEASGYEKDELIGQPHNILRHPDVPKAVFADMWQTLQSGKPWVQIVKNRCKNGDHYWVEANVTPILENGKVVGYQSVRTSVSGEMKESAQYLYGEIGKGRAKIQHGYLLGGSKTFCLFNKIHPMTLMLMIIAILGGLATSISAGLFEAPFWVIGAISIALYLYAWAGTKYIFGRLAKTKRLIDRMREGDFSAQVDFYGHHGLSKLISAVKMMQIQLGARYEEDKEKLHSSLRMQASLENASAQIMVVNPDGTIRYLNKALLEFLEKSESRILEDKPQFSCKNLIGRTVSDVFDQDTEFDNLTDKKHFETGFCGLTLDVMVTPVITEDNHKVGTVIEIKDMTQQRVIEYNLKSTLDMASQGHTDLELKTEGLEGFLLDISVNVNELVASLNEIIEEMVSVMTNLAKGDIRSRLEKDLQGSLAAMKGATNVSLDNLSGIIMYLKQASASVDKAAKESSQASMDLSGRTQQAAATLEEINATMKNINHAQNENATELNKVSNLADSAVNENTQAKQAIQSTVDAIEEIKDTSEKIANIIGMIDSIAFQTNLLALNAAVEAARAGEHGRGFAVVAGEVRTLAQKSADAAKDIKGLIDESVEKVQLGVSKVQDTSDAFEKVNEGVVSMSSSLQGVLTSIQDQQQSVVEVTQAIDNLDANIQNNAALVERTSAAAEALKDQAVLLNNETSKFSINEQAAQRLIQSTPDIHGIFMADVRQSMRIWRTNMQSYLNGVNVSIDLATATDPSACNVGKSLNRILQAEPSIENMPEFKKVKEAHTKQHAIVKEVLELMGGSQKLDFDAMKVRDNLMDNFVGVTNQLDVYLGELNNAYFSGSYSKTPLNIAG